MCNFSGCLTKMATKRKEVPTSHEPLYKIMITENYSHRIPDIVQRRVHKAYDIKLSWPWPGPAPFDCLAILAVQLLRDMNIPTALAKLVGEYTNRQLIEEIRAMRKLAGITR